METLCYELLGSRRPAPFAPVLVGVVASGNLEVLVESTDSDRCILRIDTSARGFGTIWEAVVRDFHGRHRLAGVALTIHDMGATPAIVSLRLEQAAAQLEEGRA